MKGIEPFGDQFQFQFQIPFWKKCSIPIPIHNSGIGIGIGIQFHNSRNFVPTLVVTTELISQKLAVRESGFWAQ